MKKVTIIVLIVSLAVLGLVFSPPTLSISNNPCQSCHSSEGYYQYLDILEGDSGNQIPSTLSVDQTITVKVVVLNDVNTATYSTMNGVSLTLSSANGHFKVTNPTYTIGSLPSGTTTATWQITGTSDGYDYLNIQATGYNTHGNCYFSDTYSPYPLITIGQPTGTPEPFPTPTPPASTPTPTQSTSTPAPTSTATLTNTPSTSTQPSASPSTTQTTLSIQITAPTQGEHLPIGSKQTIQWQATGGTSTLKVKLEYIINNKQWITLATDLPGSGSYQWTTPDMASTCAIRATIQDSSSSVQSASTITSFEVEEAQGIDWITITIVAAVVTVLLAAVFVVVKMRAKKPS